LDFSKNKVVPMCSFQAPNFSGGFEPTILTATRSQNLICSSIVNGSRSFANKPGRCGKGVILIYSTGLNAGTKKYITAVKFKKKVFEKWNFFWNEKIYGTVADGKAELGRTMRNNKMQMRGKQGCQIFRAPNIPIWEKYTM
jgi:hypothetical protein